jgi:hypothetical protein
MHTGWTQEEYEARVAAYSVLYEHVYPDGKGGLDFQKHAYLSTACVHGEHGRCLADALSAGAKAPGQCKLCAAPCICACHEEGHAVQESGAASQALRHQPEGGGGVRGQDAQGQEAARKGQVKEKGEEMTANRLLQLGVFALVVGGFVVLSVQDKDVSAFVGLVTPILSALFVVNHLSNQDQVLRKINEQTNGVLTQRIKDAVSEALSDRDAML